MSLSVSKYVSIADFQIWTKNEVHLTGWLKTIKVSYFRGKYCLTLYPIPESFLAHARLSGALSLWHTAVSICLSVCISVHNFKMLLLEYALMDFRHTWSNDHRVRTKGVFRNLGVQRSSRGLYEYCWNTFKMLLRLHDSIDFDEIYVKRSFARGSLGVFRNFWSEVILGSYGTTVERSNLKQPSKTKLIMPVCWSISTIEKCLWWPLRPTCD